MRIIAHIPRTFADIPVRAKNRLPKAHMENITKQGTKGKYRKHSSPVPPFSFGTGCVRVDYVVFTHIR